MAEIMFEEFQVPAFYIANTGVLNTYVGHTRPGYALTSDRFAAGKGSALVIDIGNQVASVTPVVDGFVLRKGALRAFALYPHIKTDYRIAVFGTSNSGRCTCTEQSDTNAAAHAPSSH